MNEKKEFKQYLYSPWRMEYIISAKEKECIFCFKGKVSDKNHYIVYRSKFCFVMLNLFPYNNGHLMVVPKKHAANLGQLSETELTDLMKTVQRAESVLYKVYKCDGINIGMNIGKVAGAGIDSHIHVHLVPRWAGDCNFMTVVGGVRVIPEDFELTYAKLKKAFSENKK